MKNKTVNNAKVGIFVLAGVLFLIFMLYMIGRNRNLLGSSFIIKAAVSNVNGLVPGNNVRFKGIDVGTVKSIAIENDTAIYVTMLISNKMKPYIKKNAVASIGTDGLMGSKLININPQPGISAPVGADEVIYSRTPVETDEMLRTLSVTNENVEKITQNLFEITEKLNNSISLWALLADSSISDDVKTAVADLRKAGANTAEMTQAAKTFAHQLENKDGLVYRMFADTSYVHQLSASLQEIQQASNQAALTVQELQLVVNDMKQGEGTAGLILTDTLLRTTLMNSAQNIEEGTYQFNQNMLALKNNFLFRGYFRKLEKQQKKELNKQNLTNNK